MRYIDADKLKEELKHSGYCNNNWLDIEMYINNQPTADVRENVRGEWRTTYLDHIAMGERPKILYCSICNQCIAYPTNYCPNCGADMRGDKQ